MNATRRVILAGGSGFLGRALCPSLVREGYQPVILSRSSRPAEGPVRFLSWDGKSIRDYQAEFDGAAAVINLTGKSVNCRYTSAARREILASRVDSVRALGDAVRQCSDPPRVWIQAGSLAIYGNAGKQICTEETAPGSGFSVDVCRQWETAFDSLRLPQTRKVLLRIGFALQPGEGALATLEKITRCFLGGTVGGGEQFISWIHIADLRRMFLKVLEDELFRGPYNATGPNPVTNEEFMRALRHTLQRPLSPPVPALLVRLGAWIMRTESDLALHGFRCLPQRFVDRGFRFEFPQLEAALTDLYDYPSLNA